MLSEEITQRLVSLGVVQKGVNWFIGDIPPRITLPCATIYETGGSEPQELLDGTISFERQSFQIIGRAEDTEAGDVGIRQLMQSIWKALAGSDDTAGVSNVVLSGVVYQNIKARGSVGFAGYDENGKRQYSANFEAAKQVS